MGIRVLEMILERNMRG